jgi:hypothetical protein
LFCEMIQHQGRAGGASDACPIVRRRHPSKAIRRSYSAWREFMRADVRKSPGTDMDPASRILRRVRIQDVQLPAAKVSNPKFRGKVWKFPRYFKGHLSIGNVQVRILPGQPGSHSTQDSTVENAESARQMRPFASLSSVSIHQNSTICERNRRKSLANT